MRVDLVGKKFGRFTVEKFIGVRKRSESHSDRIWQCRCECGAIRELATNLLTSGHTQSCGCLKIETSIENGHRNHVHGACSTPEYFAWIGIRRRCDSPSQPGWKRYGGRGIRVCRRWERFENFLADMGLRPSPKHSIDRIDNDGDYEPGNCRWATKQEQARNRGNNRVITIGGEGRCFVEWCEHFGIGEKSKSMVLHRLRKGMSAEDAFTLPTSRRLR